MFNLTKTNCLFFIKEDKFGFINLTLKLSCLKKINFFPKNFDIFSFNFSSLNKSILLLNAKILSIFINKLLYKIGKIFIIFPPFDKPKYSKLSFLFFNSKNKQFVIFSNFSLFDFFIFFVICL